MEVCEGGSCGSEYVDDVAFGEGLFSTDSVLEEGADGCGAVLREQVVEIEPTAAAAATAIGAARLLVVVDSGAYKGNDMWVQWQASMMLQLHFRGMVRRDVAFRNA